jgi:site-specific DNA recombinase
LDLKRVTLEKVDLRKNGIEISMNLESLLPRDSRISGAPTMTFTRFVPLQMKRRGVAMRLVIGDGISTRKTDPTLLKAIARGHKWFNELVSGRAPNEGSYSIVSGPKTSPSRGDAES